MVAGRLGWDPVQIPVANTTAQTAKDQKHSIQELSHIVPQPFLSLPPHPLMVQGASWTNGQPQDPGAQGPALHTPPWDSGGPCPSKTPPGPHPAALRPQEVPALSTPGCVGSYSHLPAGVGLGVINHQLQGLPLVGLDEREEVLGLRQTRGLSPAPSETRHFSRTAPISPHPIQGAWGRAGHRCLTSWRIWSEPTT